MKKSLLCALLLGPLLVATGCALALPTGETGSVGMMPFWDEERGIRGNKPLDGWSDKAVLRQEPGPPTKEELVAAITEATDLVALPRSVRTYRGAHLDWELAEVECQVYDAGPGIYRLNLAFAEKDGRTFWAALITTPAEYEAHTAMYDTVYEKALYALAPMD